MKVRLALLSCSLQMQGLACSEEVELSTQLDWPAELASQVVMTAYDTFLLWQEDTVQFTP